MGDVSRKEDGGKKKRMGGVVAVQKHKKTLKNSTNQEACLTAGNGYREIYLLREWGNGT